MIMKIKTVHLVYFSATYTTRTVARCMAQAMGCETVEHDVTCSVPQEETALTSDGELLIAAAPVYAGRIPGRMAEALRMFSGNGTPAIVVCVYGNRDYDDALAELQDCVEAQGFRAVAAAAFIGRHCIFPAVATGRPDDADMQKAADFAARCASLLADTGDIAMLTALKVKGNRPYKQGGASTFCPTGGASLCTKCLTCVSLCPTGAIGGRPLRYRQRPVHGLRTLRGGVSARSAHVPRRSLRRLRGKVHGGVLGKERA